MGIQGLLSFVKNKDEEYSAIKPGHLIKFKGKKAAIDAYSWLHKGVYTCARELFMGQETTRYVEYCMKNLKVLQLYNITPVLVFDGGRMPFKVVEEQRRNDRKRARAQATDLLAVGKINESYNYMVQAIDVTHEMASNLIKAAREIGVDSIVAPYEADSQLAYLQLNNFVDFVVTEDSDLIVFGCTNIFFKMHTDGHGEIYNQNDLEKALRKKSVRFSKFSFDKFRYAAIISGCDYIKSLPGIGLVKAWKFINMTDNDDIQQFLKKIPSYLKLSVTVDEEYISRFINALYCFKYQPVFDPKLKMRVPLTNPEIESEDYRNFVNMFDKNSLNELELALGNIDGRNNKYDSYDGSCSQLYSTQEKIVETKTQVPAASFFEFKSYKNSSTRKKFKSSLVEETNEDSSDALLSYYSSIDPEKKVVEEVVEEPPKKKPRKCRFARSNLSIQCTSGFFNSTKNNCDDDDDNMNISLTDVDDKMKEIEIEDTICNNDNAHFNTNKEDDTRLESPKNNTEETEIKSDSSDEDDVKMIESPESSLIIENKTHQNMMEVSSDNVCIMNSNKIDDIPQKLKEIQNVSSSIIEKPKTPHRKIPNKTAKKIVKGQTKLTGFFKKL